MGLSRGSWTVVRWVKPHGRAAAGCVALTEGHQSVGHGWVVRVLRGEGCIDMRIGAGERLRLKLIPRTGRGRLLQLICPWHSQARAGDSSS